jgi:mRNA interferase MazF
VVTESSIGRGEVYLVDLDPTRRGEIRKTRPCVILTPDELNAHLRTFIIAPLTSGSHTYPFRIPCRFKARSGHIVLDQIRTVDRERLVRRLGRLTDSVVRKSLSILQEMFAP